MRESEKTVLNRGYISNTHPFFLKFVSVLVSITLFRGYDVQEVPPPNM